MKITEDSESCQIFHIKSGIKSRCHLKLFYDLIPSSDTNLQVSFRLQRSHSSFENEKVVVCEKHRKSRFDSPIFPIAPQLEDKWLLDPNSGILILKVGKTNIKPWSEMVTISFLCNDTCNNSRSSLDKIKAAKDLVLNVSLLKTKNNICQISRTISFPLWVKSKINSQDLQKKIRRRSQMKITQKTDNK